MAAENLVCDYSGLPSLMVYQFLVDEEGDDDATGLAASAYDIGLITEMAWKGRASFDAIKVQFGLGVAELRKLLKAHMKASSYKVWRRLADGGISHAKTRLCRICKLKGNQ